MMIQVDICVQFFVRIDVLRGWRGDRSDLVGGYFLGRTVCLLFGLSVGGLLGLSGSDCGRRRASELLGHVVHLGRGGLHFGRLFLQVDESVFQGFRVTWSGYHVFMLGKL